MYKIAVFYQKEQVDELIDAMSKASAGNIGNYSHAAFITKGQGNWFSKTGTNPVVGTPGKMNRVEECKIEMICPKNKLTEVVRTIRTLHNYEEPAIDILKLSNLPK